MLLANQWTPRTFELPDRSVRVEADHEQVAEFPGALEIIHMAVVEKIETAVRCDDPSSMTMRGCSPSGRLRKC
jgi:hypothetical protein